MFSGIIIIFLSLLFMPILLANAQILDDQYTGTLTFEISDTPTASNFYSISGYFLNSEGLPLENKSIIIEKRESDKSNTLVMNLNTDETGETYNLNLLENQIQKQLYVLFLMEI